MYKVDDETSWRIKQFPRKTDFNSYIAKLSQESMVKAKPESLPEWGDQLLVLVTCTNTEHKERYVVYGRMRQIIYATDESTNVTKMNLDQTPTISRWADVPGRGKMMVYAQNDPLWANFRYESRTSNKKRVFGEGGCGPTSVAMAIANLVPAERLADIYGYAKNSLGYTFCQCSVNQYFCTRLHAQYQIRTQDEYMRYYPMVMAGFATGNNMWNLATRGTHAGTGLKFLKKVAWLYKLDLQVTYDDDIVLDAVYNGALAIANLGQNNPFTGGGHYVVIASVDDQYVYFLDPFRQANYDKTDKWHVLTQLSPGVVRVKREDTGRLAIAVSYILTTTADTTSPLPPAVQ